MTSHKTTDPYAGMRTRRHWKREHAARALADWAESGETLAAFARRHQPDPRWLAKLIVELQGAQS